MSNSLPPESPLHQAATPQTVPLLTKRLSAADRIALSHLAAMGPTVAETVGQGTRQRLVWLGFLASPLLFPIALPGMASAVGTLCMLVALGLCMDRSMPLPHWLGQRELSERVQSLLARMMGRVVRTMARWGRPRWLSLSSSRARWVNGLVLATAGFAMVVPVPMITFDNVLPALAIVLITWGLRLRDGLMLLAGYVATAAALASVLLMWWGGSVVATKLLTWAAS